jgi:hypothetical protein
MKLCLPATLSVVVIAAALGCREKTPNRDYIPILKQRVYLLQQAVKERDAVALDSLLSPDLKESAAGADSLVKFVTAPSDSFPFARFADCEIYYNDNRARADCDIVDAQGKGDRRITLTLENYKDHWLLKRFEPGLPTPGADSTQ